MSILTNLRNANKVRQEEWVGTSTVDPLFAATELAGEAGEVCNVVKKLVRESRGMTGSRSSRVELAEELADVLICVDLLAMAYNIDLNEALPEKFNKTSDKYKLTTKM